MSSSILVVTAVAAVVFAIVTREWGYAALGVFFVASGLSNIEIGRRTERALRAQRSGEGTGGSGGAGLAG